MGRLPAIMPPPSNNSKHSRVTFPEAEEIDADGNGNEAEEDDGGVGFGECADGAGGFFAA